LSACPLGQQVRVVAIASSDAACLERLSALGLVPGSTIVLKQRHPAYVVRVGGTELALDRKLAECIHVGWEAPPDEAAVIMECE
jgi:ferrous iron transport protein A